MSEWPVCMYTLYIYFSTLEVLAFTSISLPLKRKLNIMKLIDK